MSKSKIVMLVLSVIILLVIIGSATFAYFEASENVEDLPVNITTSGDTYVLTAEAGQPISLNVTAAAMSVNGVSNESPIATGFSSLTVSLLSANNDTTTNCTYDIEWHWTTGAGLSIYNEVDNNYTLGSDIGYFDDNSGAYCGVSASTNCNTLKKFNYEMSIKDSILNVEKDLTSLTSAGENKLKISTNNSISSSSAETETENEHIVTMNVYNMPFDQTNIRGKSFSGNVAISNIHCTMAPKAN